MKRHTLKEWILATRPWSFPASTMPVFVSMMFLWSQGYEVSWRLGIMALVNIVLVHAAGNVWSDYHDYKRGVDAADTFGVRILTDKQFTPKEVLSLSIILQVHPIYFQSDKGPWGHGNSPSIYLPSKGEGPLPCG